MLNTQLNGRANTAAELRDCGELGRVIGDRGGWWIICKVDCEGNNQRCVGIDGVLPVGASGREVRAGAGGAAGVRESTQYEVLLSNCKTLTVFKSRANIFCHLTSSFTVKYS